MIVMGFMAKAQLATKVVYGDASTEDVNKRISEIYEVEIQNENSSLYSTLLSFANENSLAFLEPLSDDLDSRMVIDLGESVQGSMGTSSCCSYSTTYLVRIFSEHVSGKYQDLVGFLEVNVFVELPEVGRERIEYTIDKVIPFNRY